MFVQTIEDADVLKSSGQNVSCGGGRSRRRGGGNSSKLLLHLIVSLQHVLQLGRDLLEEGDLSAQVLLHLATEVANPGAVEVLDLSQRGTRDDVAALMELALLLGAVLHLGQRTLQETNATSNLVGRNSDLFKFKRVRTRSFRSGR